MDERERTFEDSGLGGGWPWREGTLSARAMAEAGMVWWPWEGEDGRGRVVCVWCSGIEEGWREGDHPSEEHARFLSLSHTHTFSLTHTHTFFLSLFITHIFPLSL